MPYLIDGHNLIPHLRGLRLDEIDDEMRLVDLLDDYFRGIRRKAIVYFDRGQPGNQSRVQRSFVTAHFTRPPLIADQAIRARLRKLGGEARNYTVVSSDHEVRDYAQRVGAQARSSREFARMVQSGSTTADTEKSTGEDDMDYWLGQFTKDS